MKFDCGPTREVKHASKKQWHKWYAWHPVRMGERKCIWLEVIERKGTFYISYSGASWWNWEYRLCA